MALVEVSVQDNIAVVTMNHPDALNALNSEVLSELEAHFARLAIQEDVHVVVITGAGRAFVAGADISEMANYSPMQAKFFSRQGNSTFMYIENFEKPVIAAVNGFALGGGCELAMSCDFRIASVKAKFGLPEVGLGIIPGFGGTQRLGRLIGLGKAIELTLTNEIITAEKALEVGLVNYVVSPDELMPKVMEIAATIASKPQVAVRQAKAAIRTGADTEMHSAVAVESEAFSHCFATEDQKDAMAAFLKKEKIEKFKNK
ncbi:MAG: enoyl-CoA hydratase-related protein [Eubacteriales bacterium]